MRVEDSERPHFPSGARVGRIAWLLLSRNDGRINRRCITGPGPRTVHPLDSDHLTVRDRGDCGFRPSHRCHLAREPWTMRPQSVCSRRFGTRPKSTWRDTFVSWGQAVASVIHPGGGTLRGIRATRACGQDYSYGDFIDTILVLSGATTLPMSSYGPLTRVRRGMPSQRRPCGSPLRVGRRCSPGACARCPSR